MPRRTIHRRRRAQGGCLSFAIAVLTLAALALVVAIVITGRLKQNGDDITKPVPTGGSYVDVNDPSDDSHDMVVVAEGADAVAVADPRTDRHPRPHL